MSSRRIVKNIIYDDTKYLLNNTKTLVALSTCPTTVDPTPQIDPETQGGDSNE
jgi:hypothetical protein